MIFHGTKIYGKAHIFNSSEEENQNKEIIHYISNENNWRHLSGPKKYTILSFLELDYVDTIENECSPFKSTFNTWKSDLKITLNNGRIIWVEANGNDHFNGLSFNWSMTNFFASTYRFFSKLNQIHANKDSIVCINMLIPYIGDNKQLLALQKMISSDVFKRAIDDIYNGSKWVNINLKSDMLIFRRKFIASKVYIEETPQYFQKLINKYIAKNPQYIEETVNIFNNLLKNMIADTRYEIYV